MCANRELRSRSFILAHRFLGEVGWARHRVRTCNILRLPFGERREIPPCGRDDSSLAFLRRVIRVRSRGALRSIPWRERFVALLRWRTEVRRYKFGGIVRPFAFLREVKTKSTARSGCATRGVTIVLVGSAIEIW